MSGEHRFYVNGVVRPVAVCSCGWVSERHRSRGEAHLAWEVHVWLKTSPIRRRVRAVYGTDARRKSLTVDQERRT